ncbi:MAG: DNA helicase RecQ [Gemmataceae bacterium]
MPSPPDAVNGRLMGVIARHWGFDALRPLQEQAMHAILDGRDSVVVLPTGGGKSLCYQAPAVLRGGTTVVVSPLIALMKDQVDGLRACGVEAAQLDSSQTARERFAVECDLREGRLPLLFVSPERLVGTDLPRVLEQVGVHTFAIDEAHCISHWGHDFRPEYRMLAKLRDDFPQASFHAYTATATEQVRRDISAQLHLRDPLVLVGNFDRPNLTYRVWPRHDVLKQVTEVLERHPGEAGIVYCMRRRDVDDLTARLRDRGVNALAYHAGLSNEERQRSQEEFAAERCDIVVATIAFGMGIDRSNVRFVVHIAMPKSLEHYQQETGRAGRDGLEAECVLLYSGGDVASMRAMIQKSAAEAADRSFLPGVLKHLEDMDRFARGACCRHKALVGYFGQDYPAANCNACDLCLGDTEDLPDAKVAAQKILSCVARLKQRFGIGQVLDVLRGKNNEKVRKYGHETLTTYGLLKDATDAEVRDWIYQLIGQEVLVQTEEEYPTLRLNEASWQVMRGERDVRLVRLVRRQKGDRPARSQAAAESWEGVDTDLFDRLKKLRRQLAEERQVPSYVVFGDNTLRELARLQPTTLEAMRQVYGIGEAKLRDFGGPFLDVILTYRREHPETAGSSRTRLTSRQQELFALFSQRLSVEAVVARTGLARSTVYDYLAAFVAHERVDSLAAWVDDDTCHRVRAAVRQVGAEKLRPIYVLLGEQVPYELIRVVVAAAAIHRRADPA